MYQAPIARLAFVLCCASALNSAASAEEWTNRKVSKDGWNFSISVWTNASNLVTNEEPGFTHKPPVIIHSDAKFVAPASGIFGTVCPSGSFLNWTSGKCYACPTGFEQNALPSEADPRKCVRFFDPANGDSDIYNEKLLVDAKYSPRQIRCIRGSKACYTGIIGFVGGERYGAACGWKYGGADSELTDNVDKCCQAHDHHYWDNNINWTGRSGQPNQNCANDVNLLRCVTKVLGDQTIYFTEEASAAAQWLRNALNIPTGGLCQSDWNTNDAGQYPWKVAECDSDHRAKCYTHVFEGQTWFNDPNQNVVWCPGNPSKTPPC